MFTPLLVLFVLCLLYNYIQGGGSFILFSRVIDVARSLRESTPRGVKSEDNHLFLEYKCGERFYSIIFPKRNPIQWRHVAAFINGEWVDKTGEMLYYAGPYKNFYEIPITPKHINESWDKIGFYFDNDYIIKVSSNEIIIKKLLAKMKRK